MRISILLLMTLIGFISNSTAAEYYVAIDGSDSNPGTIEQPFRSFSKVQALLENKDKDEELNIYVRKGTYFLNKPLTVPAGIQNLTISGYKNEKVFISGGVPLKLDWSHNKDQIWKAAVSEDTGTIDELYINGQRYHMARYPNYDSSARFFGGTSADAISPDRVKTWSDPIGGYMHALHRAMWGSKHYQITGVNDDGSLELKGGWQENRGGGFDPYFRGGYHNKYLFVENIFEELDTPGEWYFDDEKNLLYVYPYSTDNLITADVIGTQLKQLFISKGSKDKPVRNVHLSNLHFQHTSRVFMEPYERLLRGDWSIARLAAVYLEGTEDCSIENCYFEKLGGNGVFISRYNRRISITGCRFAELGESCVCIVGDVNAVRSPAIEYSNTLPQDEIDLTPGPKTDNYPAYCVVHDNLMHSFGRVGKQTAGVFISMSEQITVSHNTIYNCPRAAICINDGCWGGHRIEYNDAFNTVRESGDHGPFNSWGRDRFWKTSYNGGRDIEPFAKERALLDNYKTTHIRYNRFSHDHGHSWGIDLDDGSSNYHVYKNLCLGMGVKLREGFYRRVENNIIVNGFGGFHIWFPDSEDVIAHNIFVSEKPYQFIRANPEYAKQFDYNLFCNEGEMPMITGVGQPMTLKEWQGKGFDTHSLLADPMFIDPKHGDYRVKPESPALKLGFENFPMDQFGVLKPEFQSEIAKVERKFQPAPAKTKSTSQRNPKPTLWQGATVKNLIGEAEKSAAGMGEETGVLIMDVPEKSHASTSGLKAGDVIIGLGQNRIHSVKDLISLTKTNVNKTVTMKIYNAVERMIMIELQ